MAVTAENARLNLRTVSANVAARLGLNPANMTYDQRRGYNVELAAEIQKYPQSFTPEILAIASKIKDTGALSDSSFSWGDFGSETLGNAPAVLGGFTNKLLMGLVVVAVAYIVVKNWPPGASPARA